MRGDLRWRSDRHRRLRKSSSHVSAISRGSTRTCLAWSHFSVPWPRVVASRTSPVRRRDERRYVTVERDASPQRTRDVLRSLDRTSLQTSRQTLRVRVDRLLESACPDLRGRHYQDLCEDICEDLGIDPKGHLYVPQYCGCPYVRWRGDTLRSECAASTPPRDDASHYRFIVIHVDDIRDKLWDTVHARARLRLRYPERPGVWDEEIYRVEVTSTDDTSFEVVDLDDPDHDWSVYWSEVLAHIVEVESLSNE